MYKNESMGLATRRLSSFLCHHPRVSGAFVCAAHYRLRLSRHYHPHTHTLTHTLVDFRSEKDGARMESFLVRLFLPPPPPPLPPPTTTLLFQCKGEEGRIYIIYVCMCDYEMQWYVCVCVCKEEKAGKKTTQSSTAFHRSR